MKTEILICECSDIAHQLVFRNFENEREVYIGVHLNDSKSFFERFIYGIKYIFGYKSKFGAFDEIITSVDELQKIIDNISPEIEMTYEERVRWFLENYYETGMEYEILLETMKDKNLDSFEFYDEVISIPKYKSK